MKTRTGLSLVVMAMGLVAGTASAMTMLPVDHVCPVGGEKFTAQTVGSGTAFGRFLDGQLYGPIGSPWPLVECPGNGLLLYKRDVSTEEIARLTPYVESAQYQTQRQTETSYWRLALLLRHMGESDAVLASVLRQATWQAQGEQYPRYVAAAAAAWQAQCRDDAGQETRDEDWLYCQMMLGEWERRLSRFEAAQVRFTRLQPWVDTLVSSNERSRARRQYTAVIEQQLQLIAAGDASQQRAVNVDQPAPQPPT